MLLLLVCHSFTMNALNGNASALSTAWTDTTGTLTRCLYRMHAECFAQSMPCTRKRAFDRPCSRGGQHWSPRTSTPPSTGSRWFARGRRHRCRPRSFAAWRPTQFLHCRCGAWQALPCLGPLCITRQYHLQYPTQLGMHSPRKAYLQPCSTLPTVTHLCISIRMRQSMYLAD